MYGVHLGVEHVFRGLFGRRRKIRGQKDQYSLRICWMNCFFMGVNDLNGDNVAQLDFGTCRAAHNPTTMHASH